MAWTTGKWDARLAVEFKIELELEFEYASSQHVQHLRKDKAYQTTCIPPNHSVLPVMQRTEPEKQGKKKGEVMRRMSESRLYLCVHGYSFDAFRNLS